MAKRRNLSPARKSRNWTEAHTRRLFWRAGFGATPGQIRLWTKRGKKSTLDYLLDSTEGFLTGPAPTDYGTPLDPLNEFGHDKLWWLDRMVRTNRPLHEKMTLFWHDHFATRSQPTTLMLRQNETLRKHGLGPFSGLLYAMTLDPALARFLSLVNNVAEAPNENFARELMELFALGSGYSEEDIREAARALTGVRAQRENGQVVGVYFDSSKHDSGMKTIFGQTGRWALEDVLRLCLEHPAHAPFLVGKLWNFFITEPIPEGTRARLAASYVASGLQLRPLVRSILAHPALYSNLRADEMVKWPVVYVAGQLRTMGAPVNVSDWNVLMASMGQTLFSPPSVAGWDWGTRWLSTNAMRARFGVASVLVRADGAADAGREVRVGLTPDEHIDLALSKVGHPAITPATRRVLKRFVAGYGPRPGLGRSKQLQRALRHLIISGPDNQLC